MIHEGLEHSGSIGKSHQHDQELKGAIVCLEGCLPLMASCDTNIVVANVEVEVGVDLCTAQLVKEIGDEWNWVPILPCDLVEVVEVDTEFVGCHPSSSQREQVHHLAIEMIG